MTTFRKKLITMLGRATIKDLCLGDTELVETNKLYKLLKANNEKWEKEQSKVNTDPTR